MIEASVAHQANNKIRAVDHSDQTILGDFWSTPGQTANAFARTIATSSGIDVHMDQSASEN